MQSPIIRALAAVVFTLVYGGDLFSQTYGSGGSSVQDSGFYPAGVGSEYGASAPGVGYTLLSTIPAGRRHGYVIQAQCTAGLLVSFEEALSGPSYLSLAGPSVAGGHGGSVSMSGIPYDGVIKVFSTDAACRHTAWVNQ